MAFADSIKVVLIDVDDTLLDFRLCSQADIRHCLGLYGIPYSDHLFETFEKRNNRYWQDIEAGLLTVERLREIRWVNIFKELGIDADGLSFEKDFIKHLKDFAIPVEGAVELMQYLHSKYRVFIVSNATHEQQNKRLADAGLDGYADAFFTSLDIGYVKPTKEYFDACFALLPDVKPSETIIIGDSLTADIKGASDYGIHTCWFNKYHKKAPEGLSIDLTVEHLRDIIGLL